MNTCRVVFLSVCLLGVTSLITAQPQKVTITDSDHMVWVGFSLKPLLSQIAQKSGDQSGFSSPADNKTVVHAETQALKDLAPLRADAPANDSVGSNHVGFIRGRKISERQHWAWFLKQLRSVKAVRIGMRREMLLKIVAEEGGLSGRTQQTFVGKRCPELKIDVKFQAQTSDPRLDTVSSVSVPHIDYSVID